MRKLKKKIEYSATDALNIYLNKEYSKCTSYNIDVNYRRGVNIHNAIKYLLYSAFPMFISGGFFVIGDMDASSPRKEILVKNSSPFIVSNDFTAIESILLELKESCMNSNEQLGQENTPTTPPTAPEPPESRNIIESQDPPVSMDQETGAK